MKRSLAIIALALPIGWVVAAGAETIPLPRPRPAGPIPKVEAARPAVLEASACRQRLTAERAIAPSVDPIEGPGDCGAVDLVRLEAVVLPDNSRVAVNPPAVLRCSMAEAIVDWVRDDLNQLAAFNLGSRLKAIRNFAAYHCRSRNNVIGAMMSEHGRANALDIRSITLSNGKTVDPTDRAVSREFREGWKQSVCRRFSTVLGPGSDGYHENHIHVDLMPRRNGYRSMCQWAIHVPATPAVANAIPLPPPRPKLDAPAAAR